ncbi:MAG: effector binding domain-containing protein [Bacillaceae bacterium]|nr:effector binding domain-containing protein [Bacillaceae bacterium]
MKIVTKDSITTAAFGWSGSFEDAQDGAVRKLWAKFLENLDRIPNPVNLDSIICPFHDRETDFTYYIGLEVEETRRSELPEGMTNLIIPARQYATFTHSGPVNQVYETYKHAYSELEREGIRLLSDTLKLEVYSRQQAKNLSSSNNIKFDIYLPIQP